LAKIGEIIEGKYEILKQIGKGGMSNVYLAMDRRLNKQWAIKEILRRGADPKLNEVVINSAIVEANMIKSLDHYHIPHINDILEHEEYIYVVMDYVEGESLANILRLEGPQTEKQVIKWGKQLCDALNYLHTRNPSIIYRDMKPSNVMIKPDGDVKLIDFGIAREYKEKNLADTMILGTVGYAPPEQFGGGQTDARADIFALGATLYHAVTGCGPKKGEAFIIRPIRNINPDLSGGLEKIILKCTRQNPDERYASCAELMYDLEHYTEMDDAFLEKQKSHLRLFVSMAAMFVVCLAIGIFAQVMKGHTIDTDYSQNLLWAQSASEEAQKTEYYMRAIEIKPTEDESYLGLIDTFKSDTDFSTDEERELLAAINSHIISLKEQSFYPDLAYELGILYWYYYGYGRSGETDSNQSARMQSSIRWFSDVVDMGGEDYINYKVARIYRDIGNFNKNIGTQIAEASDSGKYKPFWDNLGEMVELIADDADEPEIVRLTVDSIVLDSIGTYARKFKSEGVTETAIRAMYETALTDARAVATSTDKTEEMRDSIITTQATIAMESITVAFREDERGLKY
jgi:serine/threonine-protein kinase